MAMVLALVRLSKLTRDQGLNSQLTPLLYHFSRKGKRYTESKPPTSSFVLQIKYATSAIHKEH